MLHFQILQVNSNSAGAALEISDGCHIINFEVSFLSFLFLFHHFHPPLSNSYAFHLLLFFEDIQLAIGVGAAVGEERMDGILSAPDGELAHSIQPLLPKTSDSTCFLLSRVYAHLLLPRYWKTGQGGGHGRFGGGRL